MQILRRNFSISFNHVLLDLIQINSTLLNFIQKQHFCRIFSFEFFFLQLLEIYGTKKWTFIAKFVLILVTMLVSFIFSAQNEITVGREILKTTIFRFITSLFCRLTSIHMGRIQTFSLSLPLSLSLFLCLWLCLCLSNLIVLRHDILFFGVFL